jgi:3-isopropylmalate dehydratase small subunit
MKRELPLYVFIRNSIIVGVVFVIATCAIINKRQQNKIESQKYIDYDINNNYLKTTQYKNSVSIPDSLISMINTSPLF